MLRKNLKFFGKKNFQVLERWNKYWIAQVLLTEWLSDGGYSNNY